MIDGNLALIKKVALIVALLAVIASVGWGVWYWVSHGRIVVKAPDGVKVKSISYCNCNPVCGSMTELQGDSVAVTSGKYVVQVSLDDQTSYVANVSVSGWLSSVTVTPRSHTFSVSPVATSTGQSILPIGDSYFTYDPESTGQMVNGDRSWSEVIGALPVDDDRLLMLRQVSYDDSVTNSLASIYDSTTGEVTTIGETGEPALAANTFYNNQNIYIIGHDNRKVIEVSVDGIKTITMPDDIKYAKYGDWPILTMNNELTAVLSGNDFVPLDDGEPHRGTKPTAVTLYNTDGFSVKKTIDIGIRSDITTLSLSPDNTKVAVIGERSIEVYGVNSGQLEFSTPSDGEGIDSLFWKDNASFVYSLDMGGVYLADLDRQEAYSIIDNDLLRITSLSGLIDDKVYLTAFPNQDGNVERTSPDGYTIDLTAEVTNPLTEDAATITRSLPYDAPGYSMSYHFTGNKMVLDIDASQGYRNAAIDSIYRLDFDPADYAIEFKDYTNPFKEYE